MNMRPDLLSLTRFEREALTAAAPRKRNAMVQMPVPGLDKVAPKKECVTFLAGSNGIRNYWVWDASGGADPR